jgi:hypothetical protein
MISGLRVTLTCYSFRLHIFLTAVDMLFACLCQDDQVGSVPAASGVFCARVGEETVNGEQVSDADKRAVVLEIFVWTVSLGGKIGLLLFSLCDFSQDVMAGLSVAKDAHNEEWFIIVIWR